ncbi:unnamed protein product [Caenorhabditis auriculariae]|uniref:Protein-tyrosine-phosphatase n=1 Tax=Caenorhabditis auriculariae TaxID=2777116 RepID=A0A8S1GW21_9PELO|nr:unnamed protein product [Caenorhabditis auriculariae]
MKEQTKTVLHSFSEIRPHLYLAGYGCITAPILKKYEITHAVDATNIRPKSFPGITRMEVAVDDSCLAKVSKFFYDVQKFIDDAKAQGGKIVIYCAAGVSRSSTLAIMYLVMSENLSLEQAYYEVNRVRPIISPNIGFWRQMIDWETTNRGEATVKLITGRTARPYPNVYLHRSPLRATYPTPTFEISSSMKTFIFSSLFLVAAATSTNETSSDSSVAVRRWKRHCGSQGCAPVVCNECPNCCSVLPPPSPVSCCDSPRPSPVCCQLPPPPPPQPCCLPPPPPPSPIVCCKAAPVPENPCCQAVVAAPPAAPACCMASPSPANPCCQPVSPPPPPPPVCQCAMPRPTPCRCAAPQIDCNGCNIPPPRCPPFKITCRVQMRMRRDVHHALLSQFNYY